MPLSSSPFFLIIPFISFYDLLFLLIVSKNSCAFRRVGLQLQIEKDCRFSDGGCPQKKLGETADL
jgi:hypothetical protein